MGRARTIIKKIFSVSLVFNALLTIGCVVSILGGVYWTYPGWKPFAPYLVNGNIFWLAIAAAIFNIYPSASLGRSLHTGRFLFHHYLYGFIVIALTIAYVVLLVPGVTLFNIFIVDSTSVAVNLGRFFILGGVALVLDDFTDVNKHLERGLNWMKIKAGQVGGFVTALHLILGAASVYVFVAVALSVSTNVQWFTLANAILLGTLFITSLTSFIFVKRRFWQNISSD
ncbi:MAG: hypothetical protein NWE92_00145 [Candidatus Bathyarchaeota archaeon]|nr:hypothetical protein [Candidatus Bathyarchaeota archaeon]